MIEITKNSDKVLCCIYKQYLEHRENGLSNRESKRFRDDFYVSDKQLSKWHQDDIEDAILELGRAKHICVFIGGDFDLEDSAIIYMENRFKNGFMEVLDTISKFIP